MPQNLEIKARIHSPDLVDAAIRELNIPLVREMFQTDTYFCTTAGRLKLREINGTTFELIGYDRGESSSRRLSNFTLFPVQSAEPLTSILAAALGIRGIVRKRRELYLHRATRIHVDVVERLGHFLEFETAVGEDAGSAHEEMNILISKFHIHETDFLRMSYIDLLEMGEERSVSMQPK